MPLSCMAVATLFTSASLQKSCVQPSSSHVTQLFQPSGGVRASPLSTAVAKCTSAVTKSSIVSPTTVAADDFLSPPRVSSRCDGYVLFCFLCVFFTVIYHCYAALGLFEEPTFERKNANREPIKVPLTPSARTPIESPARSHSHLSCSWSGGSDCTSCALSSPTLGARGRGKPTLTGAIDPVPPGRPCGSGPSPRPTAR